jgi:hypothetical protein
MKSKMAPGLPEVITPLVSKRRVVSKPMSVIQARFKIIKKSKMAVKKPQAGFISQYQRWQNHSEAELKFSTIHSSEAPYLIDAKLQPNCTLNFGF